MPTCCSSHTVQIVRQGPEPIHDTEYSIHPGAMVRLLATEASSASNMPTGARGILTDGVGVFCDHPSRYKCFENLLTTLTLVAAEVWKLSSKNYKSSLLSHLQAPESKGVALLLDQLVAFWTGMQSRGNATLQPLWDDNEDGGSSAESNSCSSGRGDAETGSHLPALRRESFDVVVATFQDFRHQPAQFGWIAGDQRHNKAVGRIADAIRSAFEAEMDGPWQQSDDWLHDEPPLASMPEDLFEALLSECGRALDLRQLRNTSSAHPFDHPNPEVRQRVLELFKEEVSAGSGVISGMGRLAVAAIGHVESLLERTSIKQLQALKVTVEPSKTVSVRDIDM